MASSVEGLWPNHQLDPGRDPRACVQRHPGSWTGSDLLSQWWSIWNQIAKALLFVILKPQVVLGLHIVRGDNICVVSGAPQRKRAWSSDSFATVRCRWARSTKTSTSVLIFTISRSIAHLCQFYAPSDWVKFHCPYRRSPWMQYPAVWEGANLSSPSLNQLDFAHQSSGPILLSCWCCWFWTVSSYIAQVNQRKPFLSPCWHFDEEALLSFAFSY